MWLSLTELKKFYEILNLTTESPDFTEQLAKLKKNVNKQPPEVSVVLNNVEAHVGKLLYEIYREYSENRISWYKNEKKSEYFGVMQHFLIDRDEFYNYVIESYKLALPLCDPNIVNLTDVNGILSDLKQNPSLSIDARNNFSINLEFTKLLLSATKKLETLNGNLAKKYCGDYNLKMSVSFLLKELALCNKELIWSYLPFCFVISKYIETKTDTLLITSLSAWRHFIRQPFCGGSHNILTLINFLDDMLLELCANAKHDTHDTDSTFDRGIYMIKQDLELKEGIYDRLNDSFTMLTPLYLYIKVISEQLIEDERYHAETLQVLKNDTPKLIQAFKRSSRLSRQKLKTDIKQYCYSLTAMDSYTPLEKNLYLVYLEKFYHQGIDIFYRHTLLDLFNENDKGRHKLGLVDHHFFKSLLFCLELGSSMEL